MQSGSLLSQFLILFNVFPQKQSKTFEMSYVFLCVEYFTVIMFSFFSKSDVKLHKCCYFTCPVVPYICLICRFTNIATIRLAFRYLQLYEYGCPPNTLLQNFTLLWAPWKCRLIQTLILLNKSARTLHDLLIIKNWHNTKILPFIGLQFRQGLLQRSDFCWGSYGRC